MTTVLHDLNTIGEYFDAVVTGKKTFEVRRDDRGFNVGDILVLKRLGLPGHRREVALKRVSYILKGGQFGIEEGYVVMGLCDVGHE